MNRKNKSVVDFFIDTSFQGVNRLLGLPFENETQWTSYKRYYLPTREIKNYNVVTDGQNFFDHEIRNSLITYDHIQNIVTGREDNYKTGRLLDYNHFKNYCKMIVINLRKQQVLDAHPKAIQQVSFTGNIEQQATKFLIIKETN